MLIDIVSDLHLEFENLPVPNGDGEVLILAGDIHTGHNATEWIRKAERNYGLVIYVAGNHEFYGNSYEYVINWWLQSTKHHYNTQFLHNSSVVYGGVRFIGTTLWTYAQDEWINDYSMIAYGGKSLRLRHTKQFHYEALQYLGKALAEPFDGPTVVVTHHAPIPECVHVKYLGNVLNPHFHGNLNNLIADNDIALWVHGHMHDSHDFEYEGTRIVCNPRGYGGIAKAENPYFENPKTVII